MTAQERRTRIMEALKDSLSCNVNTIAGMFDVTPATIRRDLTYLEELGKVKRTHGNVHLIQTASVPDYRTRNSHLPLGKQAIAKAAAALVKEGDCIIMDSGTTTHGIINELTEFKHISIITNSLSFVQDITPEYPPVMFTGGILDVKNQALIGPDAIRSLERVSASLLFLGTTGTQGIQGLTSATPFYTEIKRTMIQHAKKRVLVADSSKFTTTGMLLFASFSELDVMITDKPLENPELIKHLESCGVEVIVAEADSVQD